MMHFAMNIRRAISAFDNFSSRALSLGIGSGWIGFGRALIWSRFWLVVTHDIPLIYVHFKYKPFLDFVNYKIDIFWQSTTKRVCFYNFFITSSRKYLDSFLNEIHLDGITDGNCDRIDGVIPLQHRTVIVVGEECRLDQTSGQAMLS